MRRIVHPKIEEFRQKSPFVGGKSTDKMKKISHYREIPADLTAGLLVVLGKRIVRAETLRGEILEARESFLHRFHRVAIHDLVIPRPLFEYIILRLVDGIK